MNVTLALTRSCLVSTHHDGVAVVSETGDYLKLMFQDENEARKLAAGIELWLQCNRDDREARIGGAA